MTDTQTADHLRLRLRELESELRTSYERSGPNKRWEMLRAEIEQVKQALSYLK